MAAMIRRVGICNGYACTGDEKNHAGYHEQDFYQNSGRNQAGRTTEHFRSKFCGKTNVKVVTRGASGLFRVMTEPEKFVAEIPLEASDKWKESRKL